LYYLFFAKTWVHASHSVYSEQSQLGKARFKFIKYFFKLLYFKNHLVFYFSKVLHFYWIWFAR